MNITKYEEMDCPSDAGRITGPNVPYCVGTIPVWMKGVYDEDPVTWRCWWCGDPCSPPVDLGEGEG